jgi:multidrug resistance efflux pump
MLNISSHSVSPFIDRKKYDGLNRVESKKSGKVLRRIIYSTFVIGLIILFLPWTQNIRSNGSVTSLKPNQKPQTINSIIGGKIEEWYVQEGDFVHKGDTLLRISEIKDAYFDNQLIERTENQLKLKKQSIEMYEDKIKTQNEQLDVLEEQRDLKLQQLAIKIQQTQLKVQNDSVAYNAAKANFDIALYQYKRMDTLYQKGLKSLTDLEKRDLKVQSTRAYEIEAKNKWLNSRNDLVNLELELANTKMKYQSDVNKLRSDQFTTQSAKFDTETTVNKLANQLSNYQFRNGLYFILAPQDGYITKTNYTGLGEMIKEGAEIITMMPARYDLAVEIYVEPIDLPLIRRKEKVRLQFDGWPAIVFSGWPNASHGTYGGLIYGIDQFISPNGKYRVLIAPDPNDEPWPDALRFGSGTSAMIMLNDVPIWYELWRKINGFPPDYYKPINPSKPKDKE